MSVRALLAALLVLLIGGCAPLPEPPTRVVVNPWVGYDPLVLAREHGLSNPSELQVIELHSSTESSRALRNGLADAAALTLDEALRLADEGLALRIIAVLSESNGADAVVARPGIGTPAELRGKQIALEETALGSLVLARLLEAGGLERGDVVTTQIEAFQHASMMLSGQVDAVITFEPLLSKLRAAGYGVIFDSHDMPGEIVNVLVVRADLADHRVSQLRAAWRAGRAALEADPVRAATLLAPATELSTTEYLATLEGLRFIPDTESAARLEPEQLAHTAGGLAAHLQGLGLISRPPDWNALSGVPAEAAR